MSPAPPQGSSRKLAILCLAHWSESGRPIQEFIDNYIHASALPTADRQLAVMLVLGVLRRQQYLDIILAKFSKTPLRKMKPLTLAALRVGIFQLCFLSRIPDSAAVNETVKALKKCRQPGWLIKYVNGTLRAVARARENLPGPDTAAPGGRPVPEHPDWLVRRWQKHFGIAGTAEICGINTSDPKLCIQVNTSRIATQELTDMLRRAGTEATPGKYAPNSLVLPDFRGAVHRLPGFPEGLFLVQDQAAFLATMLCSPRGKNSRLLDGCAGLGGKTCTLAWTLPEGASVTAVEPDRRRTRLLLENLGRLKLQDRVTPVRQTLQAFAATNPDRFDGILIDAPCSGTGVIRRHPDIRWNRCPEDLPGFQATQIELLETAASLVKPGGFLVYATCSLEPEENREVIDHFLDTHPRFSLSDSREFLPPAASSLVDANGFFSPLPSDEIEGFFAARMVKNP